MRFARLLVVAWCAAVLCASLGGALPTYGDKTRKVGDKPFRCVFDDIVRKSGRTAGQLPLVDIIPRALLSHETAVAINAPRVVNLQADEWQPIRIGAFVEDLKNSAKYCTAVGETKPDFQGGTATCTEEDILTPEKNDTLLQVLLPEALQMHKKHLSVKPVEGGIKVPPLTDDICSRFTVPTSHHINGVSDYDFIVYVAAAPTEEDVVAWATTCASRGDLTPSVGVINISPAYISRDTVILHTVAHELMHALGFDIGLFQARRMVTSKSVRGKPASLVMNSPTVVAKAREHYGCDTLSYMELEDGGGAGTAASHWERRNAKDELMAGIIGIGYYTPITIAAMEDTGFYKGNYDNAELMPWGYHAGCKLLDEKCVINGVSQYPSMFCTDTTNRNVCTTDRLAIGSCDIESGGQPLPTYYQYFTDPTERGMDDLTDYCPIVTEFSSRVCLNGDLSRMPGSVTGSNARCFDASSNTAADDTRDIYAICANVRCGTDTSSYQVKVKGASDYVTCTEGMVIQLKDVSKVFTSGAITCPSRPEVCRIDQPADTSSSSATAVSSSSQPQPIASSSSSQPLSSSGATAASSSSQPQPIASSSSSHALSSSSATTASSSELSSSSSSIPTSSPTVKPTQLPPDRSVHTSYENTIILTFVVIFLTLLL